MRRFLLLCTVVICLIAGCSSNGSRDMEQEILTALDAQRDAWNRADIEGFMQAYWRSPEGHSP